MGSFSSKGRLDFIKKKNWVVSTTYAEIPADHVCLTAGPGLGQLLLEHSELPRRCSSPKGQLLSFETTASAKDWPVAMLEGEGDLIPFCEWEDPFRSDSRK